MFHHFTRCSFVPFMCQHTHTHTVCAFNMKMTLMKITYMYVWIFYFILTMLKLQIAKKITKYLRFSSAFMENKIKNYIHSLDKLGSEERIANLNRQIFTAVNWHITTSPSYELNFVISFTFCPLIFFFLTFFSRNLLTCKWNRSLFVGLFLNTFLVVTMRFDFSNQFNCIFFFRSQFRQLKVLVKFLEMSNKISAEIKSFKITVFSFLFFKNLYIRTYNIDIIRQYIYYLK